MVVLPRAGDDRRRQQGQLAASAALLWGLGVEAGAALGALGEVGWGARDCVEQRERIA